MATHIKNNFAYFIQAGVFITGHIWKKDDIIYATGFGKGKQTLYKVLKGVMIG
jgi:hypothetical protein